jgi:hypothetical protein
MGKSQTMQDREGMMQEPNFGTAYPFLRNVALLDLVAMLGLYLYGRSEHWDSLHLYGRGFVNVGIGLLAFGAPTLIGSARASTEEHYLYTHAVLNEHRQEHTSRLYNEFFLRHRALIFFGFAGSLLVAVGTLLDAIG